MTDTDPLLIEDDDAEFELTIHLTVAVSASLVPAEWAEDGAPKRLYNWPRDLTDALQAALMESIHGGGIGYDEATLITDAHDLPPSTN